MRRVWLLSMGVALLPLAGCEVGQIEMSHTRGDAGPTPDAGPEAPATEEARAFFEDEVEPVLDGQCSACHRAASEGPAFLATDPSMYESLTGEWSALLSFDSPRKSRLISYSQKPDHSGTALTGDSADVVAEWLELEAADRSGAGTDGGAPEPESYETDPIDVVEGANTMPLDTMGMSGSQISFIAERTGAGLYLSRLEVVAGPGGAKLDHPVIVTWDGETPEPDPADRFADVEVTAAPYTSEPIGPGSASLVGFPEEGQLSFLFDWAGPSEEAALPDGGMGDGGTVIPGGCRNVAQFTESAQPQFESFCTRCHGGGDATAASALDMSQMGDTGPEAQQAACNEVLSRANTMEPASSIFFQVPDPGSELAHPFKFDSADMHGSFRDNVLTWLTSETE